MVLGRIAKNFPVQPFYVRRQEAPYNHVERKEKKEKREKGDENYNLYERMERKCQGTEKTAWWKEDTFVVCENTLCNMSSES